MLPQNPVCSLGLAFLSLCNPVRILLSVLCLGCHCCPSICLTANEGCHVLCLRVRERKFLVDDRDKRSDSKMRPTQHNIHHSRGFVLPVSEDPSRKLMPHSLEPLVMTLVKEILANMWSESKGIKKRTVVPKG